MSKSSKVHKPGSAMAKLLTDKDLQMKDLRPGDLVEGIVVSVSHSEVLLDVGAKSEGVVSGSDLSDADESFKHLKLGDTIFAKVVQAENQQGYIVLSLRKAEKDKKWKGAEDAFATGSVLEATIIEYNKGGLLSDCLGLRGFIPLSHLDRSHFAAGSEAELKESLKALAGKVIKVKVIELDPLKNRFVLSEKDALSTYSDESREKRLQEIAAGTTLEGIVTGIMPFGVFIDLDGVEGLVHISEIAWEKVNNPSSYFSVGKTVKVMVLGIDDQSKKLALSVKRLSPNPWETVEKSYPVGTKVKGIVSKVVPFGAFVTIEKGLDGLIHVSEAAGPLKEGDEVEAIVIQVDGTNQKLALSTRSQK